MPLRRRFSLLVVLALWGCPASMQRFPRRAPVARADDLVPWGPMPGPRAGEPPGHTFWIGGDRREAMDVNAADEVPDSSWYTNRTPTPAEAARGACVEPVDLAQPWVVVGAAAGRALEIEVAGQRFVLEPDEPGRPERATAAEAIASRLYHAAGYNVPCARVVYVTPSILRRGPRSPAPFARRVSRALRDAARGPAGTVRVALREIPPGAPLGHFAFAGTRTDDRNDVVPHEHRRTLRASRLLAALVDHRAAGERGTLDVWRRAGPGSGWVEHLFTSFRETLGAATAPVAHPRFGDFAAAPFDPASFRPTVPNPAMSKMTERDAHWMARKLAALGSQHLRAVVREGLLSDPRDAKDLGRILRARRRKLLERYLLTWTPVSHLRVEGRALCFDDMATVAGLTVPLLRPMLHEITLNGRRLPTTAGGNGIVCARLPSGGRGERVVSIEGRPSDEPRLLPPVRVHVFRNRGGGFLVAGVER